MLWRKSSVRISPASGYWYVSTRVCGRNGRANALLEDTEKLLVNIQHLVRRKGSRLRGADAIGRRVGRDANRRKVEKHFQITITDDDLTFTRKQRQIDAEAQLDGIFPTHQSDPGDLSAENAVWAYKRLAQVEKAFRQLKTTRGSAPLRLQPDTGPGPCLPVHALPACALAHETRPGSAAVPG